MVTGQDGVIAAMRGPAFAKTNHYSQNATALNRSLRAKERCASAAEKFPTRAAPHPHAAPGKIFAFRGDEKGG